MATPSKPPIARRARPVDAREPRGGGGGRLALDRQIVHPLERLRTYIRLFVAVDVVLFTALFLVWWFWAGLAVDYGTFKLTGFDLAQETAWWLRIGVLVLLGGLLAFLVARRVSRLLRTELSLPSLALVLEKRHPNKLGGRLITAVEMADVKKAARQGYSADMVEHTIEEARRRVAEVNVAGVFAWGRLAWKAGQCVLLTALALAVGFALHVAFKAEYPGGFAHRFGDTVGIWAERNVFAMNTPWPRRAYVEVVRFDDTGHPNELRIGRDSPTPPKVTARAYKWVAVDRKSRDGWRPAVWGDLAALGVAPPAGVDRMFVKDAAGAETEMALSADRPLDDVERAAEQQVATGGADVTGVFAQLNAKADSPAMTRTLRRLAVPPVTRIRAAKASKAANPTGDVAAYDAAKPTVGLRGDETEGLVLEYRNDRLNGEVVLALDPDGGYSGEIAGLKESVKFVVRGADFATARRTITLVPPPALVDLYRDEYQPAYLHYAAPAGGGQGDLAALRQVFPHKPISLTSDKSVFAVPVGTEVEIVATVQEDKRLVKVEYVPVNPPGAARVLKQAGDGVEPFAQFGVSLRGPNAVRQLGKPTEFLLRMTDTDNVTADRAVAIQASDDLPPTVEVAIDVLRKVGNAYMITPVAKVPFIAESTIRDDHGLTRVAFKYTATKAESRLATELQMNLAVGMAGAAFGPPVRSWGTPVLLAANKTIQSKAFTAAAEQSKEGEPTVPRFADDYDVLPKETLDAIRRAAAEPLPGDRATPVVRIVKLADAKVDFFDLRAAEPSLLEPDLTRIQPQYEMILKVVARDTFVDGAAVGRTGESEPIRFLVVAESDLLLEISKDEDTQSVRLEDTVKKAADAQGTLSKVIGQINDVDNARVRSDELVLEVAKARELMQGLANDFERIARELDANRCNPKLIEKYTLENGPVPGVIPLMKKAIDGALPDAEAAVAALKSALAVSRVPSFEEQNAARTGLTRLMAELAYIQNLYGSATDRAKVRDLLSRIIDNQKGNAKAISEILNDERNKLFRPTITPPKTTTVAVGKTATVKCAIEWKLYSQGALYVRIDKPKDGDVTATPEVTVKDDKNELEFTVTAGMTPGTYTVKLYPANFPPVDVKIEVTK